MTAVKRVSRTWARARRWFPRLRDGLAVLFASGTAVGTVLFRVGGGTWAALAQGMLCAVAAWALWWRRGHPLVVTLIALLATLFTGVQMALVLAVATLIVRRRDRVAAAATVAAIAVCVIGPRLTLLHDPTTDTGVMTDTVSWTLVVGIGAAIGAYVGVRRDLLRSLEERAERAEAEREIREEQSRLSERTRIAREMHDVLAHKVSLIALQAGGLEVTSDLSPAQARHAAAQIRITARQALEDLRDVLGVLRDGGAEANVYAPQPALADIAALVESSHRAGLPVTLVGDADLHSPTTDPVGRAAYRVVQEALTNVHKHARRAATTVRIDGAMGAELIVDVVNLAPVAAGQLVPGSGLGLVGLRERIELLGGTFSAARTSTGGFRVTAMMPWPAETAAEISPSADPAIAHPVPT